jgi:hypothetical protein
MLVADLAHAKGCAETVLRVKLACWGKLPWLLCGLAHHESDVVARIATDCLPLFDNTPDKLKNTHHPLAVVLLKPGGRGRAGVEALAGGVPLDSLSEDFQAAIAKLKFIPVAERIIEAKHKDVNWFSRLVDTTVGQQIHRQRSGVCIGSLVIRAARLRELTCGSVTQDLAS